MEELALHILDIAENSVRAGAQNVEIIVEEDRQKDRLTITIRDDGEGMDEGTRRRALEPFFTTKERRRVGLGLALLADAARQADGDIAVRSQRGLGTEIVATFKHSHIDRQPLGDLAATAEALAVGNPQVDFVVEYRGGSDRWRLDTREIKHALGGEPIGSLRGIRLVRSCLAGDKRGNRGGPK